jgi:choline dehydrogenase-like flavoprotein
MGSRDNGRARETDAAQTNAVRVLSDEFNVVIVGAGPAGLWLACELALAKVKVCVLERRTERVTHGGPGAILMFNSGPAFGEAVGSHNGDPLYQASLAPAEYRELLARHGSEPIEHPAEDPRAGGRTVWLARAAST